MFEGKPSGYVGKGLETAIPIISQCPEVLSLPADISAAFPQLPIGFVADGTPSILMIFPRPNFCRFGKLSPFTFMAVFGNVLLPSS